MDEYMDTVRNDDYENAAPVLYKWLKVLFILHIAGMVMSLATSFGIPQPIAALIRNVTMLVTVYALFRLSAVNDRYRKAFIFGAVQLAGMVGSFLSGHLILSLVVSIGSLVAAYQQFMGHGEATAELDPRLSKKWSTLFIVYLLAGLLTSIASFAVTFVGLGNGTPVDTMTAFIMAVTVLPGLVLDVMYLVYMKKTLELFAE